MEENWKNKKYEIIMIRLCKMWESSVYIIIVVDIINSLYLLNYT